MDKPSSATKSSQEDGQKKRETEGGGSTAAAADKAPSKQNSTVGEKLLSRAQTMLKAATMSREHSKAGTSQVQLLYYYYSLL